MKLTAAGAIAVLLATNLCARADGIQSALTAVGGFLNGRGIGLASLSTACPEGNDTNVQYFTSAIFVPIDATRSAVLVNTNQCNAGNGSGQYLVMNLRGTSRVITDAGIGDESFLASKAYFSDDDTLILYGDRWLPHDGHCCPSKKAHLTFDLKNGTHTLTILDRQ
jgi:hypothetical protein